MNITSTPSALIIKHGKEVKLLESIVECKGTAQVTLHYLSDATIAEVIELRIQCGNKSWDVTVTASKMNDTAPPCDKVADHGVLINTRCVNYDITIPRTDVHEGDVITVTGYSISGRAENCIQARLAFTPSGECDEKLVRRLEMILRTDYRYGVITLPLKDHAAYGRPEACTTALQQLGGQMCAMLVTHGGFNVSDINRVIGALAKELRLIDGKHVTCRGNITFDHKTLMFAGDVTVSFANT